VGIPTVVVVAIVNSRHSIGFIYDSEVGCELA